MKLKQFLREMKSNILVLAAFMNLGLYFDVRLLVLPHVETGTHWWFLFFLCTLIFQFNWVLTMVGALHASVRYSTQKK